MHEHPALARPPRRAAPGLGPLRCWPRLQRTSRLCACPRGGAVFHGLAMGSTYTVKIAGPALSATARPPRASPWPPRWPTSWPHVALRRGSEVSRLNRARAGEPFAVSAATLQVFAAAQAVARPRAARSTWPSAGGRRMGLRPVRSRARRGVPATADARRCAAAIGGALGLDAAAGTLVQHRAGCGQPVGHRQGLRRRRRPRARSSAGHRRLHDRSRRRDPRPRPQRRGPALAARHRAPRRDAAARARRRAARRQGAGDLGRLPQLLHARGPALLARDRSGHAAPR